MDRTELNSDSEEMARKRCLERASQSGALPEARRNASNSVDECGSSHEIALNKTRSTVIQRKWTVVDRGRWPERKGGCKIEEEGKDEERKRKVSTKMPVQKSVRLERQVARKRKVKSKERRRHSSMAEGLLGGRRNAAARPSQRADRLHDGWLIAAAG